jgi:hypothetical protein
LTVDVEVEEGRKNEAVKVIPFKNAIQQRNNINNNTTTNFGNEDCSTKMFNKRTKIGSSLGHEHDRDQISVQLNNQSTFCRSVVQLWFCPVKLVVQLWFSAVD